MSMHAISPQPPRETNMTTPTDDDILNTITQAFRDVFDDPSFTPTLDMSRQDEPRWDSMNHLNAFFALEAQYGIRFGVAEVEEVQRISDLVRLVREKTSMA
jgi:acyl carrier protein